MIKFGILGIGNMGSTHASYLFEGKIKDAVLTAVCDISPKRIEWAKEKFGDKVALYDDAETMIKSGTIDAIIVAVPHYDHPKYVIMAFENNLHVICEKPAGVYTKQVKEMNEASLKTDRVFSLMYNQRTKPIYRKVREMVKNGEIGNMKRVIWIITDWYRTQFYYNSGGWRATWAGEGGGVLLNQCPHNLDLWQWICGMPSSVRAFMSFGKYHDIEVEDDVTAYVEYSNGATGVFITTTADSPGTNRLEIVGDKGKIVVENNIIEFWKNEISDKEYSDTAETGFDRPKCEKIVVETEGEETAHAGITQNFVNAILYGEELIGPGIEGINGLTISNAMHISAIENRTVELPFSDDILPAILDEKIKSSKFKKVVKESTANLSGTY